MSKGARNRSESHKIRRALRRTPDAYFDLVQWLRDRRYGSTNKECRDLILAGRVKADSHPLGIGKETVFDPTTMQFKQVDAVFPHVPVEFKDRVTVMPEAASEAA